MQHVTSKIKSLVKRIVGTDAIRDMQEALRQLQDAVQENARGIREGRKDFQKLSSLIQERPRSSEILPRMQKVETAVSLTNFLEKRVLLPEAYVSYFEYTYFIRPFVEYLSREDLAEKYGRLVQGIDDEESLECVNRILYIIQNNIRNMFEVLSKDEIEALSDVKKRSRSVVRISDACFVHGRYFLPVSHFEPCVFHYKCGIREIRDIEALKGKDILDVGAFIGDSALILSEFGSTVYAFEPVRENYDLLKETIRLNGRKNITPLPFGLSEKTAAVEICKSGSASGKIAFTGDRETIRTFSLDEWCAVTPGVNVGLIKVDIEGFELEFLRGARETIRRFRPALLVSMYHNPEQFFEIKPFIESLNLGYTFTVRKPLDGQALLETYLVAQ